jgi:hypothetical protein
MLSESLHKSFVCLKQKIIALKTPPVTDFDFHSKNKAKTHKRHVSLELELTESKTLLICCNKLTKERQRRARFPAG